jgi:hypothetical protein
MTMDDDIKTRMRKFRDDVDAALICDADGSIARLSENYHLEQTYVEMAIPRMYIRAGIRADILKAGCTEEEVESCYQHVCMTLNGLNQLATERSRT